MTNMRDLPQGAIMMTPLRMLVLDWETNVDPVIGTLRQAGLNPAWHCV